MPAASIASWKTQGGRTISFGKGWNEQIVELRLSSGEDANLTPRKLSEFVGRYPDRLDAYGPGWTEPHAIQDLLGGKWELSEDDVMWLRESHTAGETPQFFRPSEAFGAVSLWGGRDPNEVTFIEDGMIYQPKPRVIPAVPSEVYLRDQPAVDTSWLSPWWRTRIRRLRQRWLLRHISRQIQQSQRHLARYRRFRLPW